MVLEVTQIHGHNEYSYKGLTVKPVNGSIAVFDGNKTIFVNKHLLAYPELLESVLKHEIEHFEDVQTEKHIIQSAFNLVQTEIRDFMKEDKQTMVFGFQLKHPTAFLPFMWYFEKGKLHRIVIMNQLILTVFMIFLMLILTFFVGFF